MLASLHRHRRYILRSAIADLRHRYAGTSLGFVWNVLQPLALILVFSLVFSRIVPVRAAGTASQGVSFLLYLCAGYLPWLGFADALMRCLNAFPENAIYLKKLPIPEEVFVAKAALSAFLSMMLSLLLLPVLLLVLGQPIGWAILAVVPAAVLLTGLGFGFGLFFGTLNVFFRDIGHLMAVILQLWMWCSPIVYTVEIVPERYRALFWLNPVHPYLLAIREALLQQELAPAGTWLAMAGWDIFAILIGVAVLLRLRREIRDVL
ncbi:MAG: ABC transporter permease [Alphaproteobacteria bacterium]